MSRRAQWYVVFSGLPIVEGSHLQGEEVRTFSCIIKEECNEDIFLRQVDAIGEVAIDAASMLNGRTALKLREKPSVTIAGALTVRKLIFGEGFIKCLLFYKLVRVNCLVPLEQIPDSRLNRASGIRLATCSGILSFRRRPYQVDNLKHGSL